MGLGCVISHDRLGRLPVMVIMLISSSVVGMFDFVSSAESVLVARLQSMFAMPSPPVGVTSCN